MLQGLTLVGREVVRHRSRCHQRLVQCPNASRQGYHGGIACQNDAKCSGSNCRQPSALQVFNRRLYVAVEQCTRWKPPFHGKIQDTVGLFTHYWPYLGPAVDPWSLLHPKRTFIFYFCVPTLHLALWSLYIRYYGKYSYTFLFVLWFKHSSIGFESNRELPRRVTKTVRLHCKLERIAMKTISYNTRSYTTLMAGPTTKRSIVLV